MKNKIKTIIILFLTSLLLFGCQSQNNTQASPSVSATTNTHLASNCNYSPCKEQCWTPYSTTFTSLGCRGLETDPAGCKEAVNTYWDCCKNCTPNVTATPTVQSSDIESCKKTCYSQNAISSANLPNCLHNCCLTDCYNQHGTNVGLCETLCPTETPTANPYATSSPNANPTSTVSSETNNSGNTSSNNSSGNSSNSTSTSSPTPSTNSNSAPDKLKNAMNTQFTEDAISTKTHKCNEDAKKSLGALGSLPIVGTLIANIFCSIINFILGIIRFIFELMLNAMPW